MVPYPAWAPKAKTNLEIGTIESNISQMGKVNETTGRGNPETARNGAAVY